MIKFLTLFFILFAGFAVDLQAASKTGNVALYYLPTCGHCHKVLEYLTSINKTIPTKNVSNPMYKKELTALGKQSVPVLVVGSQTLTGADQIINYLKAHPEILN